MSLRIYDISPPLSPRLAVWPGDTPVSRQVLLDMERGDSLNLSTLNTTVHAGAHADAPSHITKEGPSIDAVGLEPYLGPVEVLLLEFAPGTLIGERHLPRWPRAPRVIFATRSYPDPHRLTLSFSALDPALIDALAERGVALVGIDTPSVDLADSEELPAHKACVRHGIAILEGLVLHDVEPGLYELIALPLRLAGFDASPVRAVLRELPPGDLD